MKRIILLITFMIIVINAYGIEKFKISIPEAWDGINAFEYPKEVLDKALLKLGYESEYVYLPSERALREVDYARCDGTFLRIKAVTAQYKNLMVVDEPLITMKTFAYTIKNESSEISWEILKDYNVAVIIGSKVIEKQLKDNMKKGTFVPVEDYNIAYKMLREGTVDYVPMFETLEGKYTTIFKEIKKCTPYLLENTFYFLINKKHLDIQEKLAKEIKKIKEDDRKKSTKHK